MVEAEREGRPGLLGRRCHHGVGHTADCHWRSAMEVVQKRSRHLRASHSTALSFCFTKNKVEVGSHAIDLSKTFDSFSC